MLVRRDRARTQAESINNFDNISSVQNLTTVSTIRKDNDLSPGVDIKAETEAKNSIQPGAIVEWLRIKGTWIVEATTGIVAKIKDTYGKEVLVNCQELKFCQNDL